MKDPILYIVESLLCSGLFLMAYQLLVERGCSYVVRRRFLVLAMVGACLVPLLRIPVFMGEMTVPLQATLGTIKNGEVTTSGGGTSWLSVALVGCYLLGVCIMVIFAAMQLFRLYSIRRKGGSVSEEMSIASKEGERIVVSSSISTPFSFGKTIYLPAIIADGERHVAELNQILAHERSHVYHRHSVERMVMEGLKTVCWFNPFVWLAAQKLVAAQEMEADREALDCGFGLNDYRATLLKHLFGVNLDMVSCMAKHPLKHRFKAMTQPPVSGSRRAWMLLPMMILALSLCAVTPAVSVSSMPMSVSLSEPDATAVPVYIVDGRQVTDLNTIDPSTIASITVYKASESLENFRQQYGPQAANGVVFVELKK